MIFNSALHARQQFVLVLLVLVAGAFYSRAAEVSLAWDAPTNNIDGTVLSDLAGYRVYHGVQSGSYSDHIDVANVTTARVTNLESGITHYFAVTAVNVNGYESDFSEELILESLAPAELLPNILLSTNDIVVLEGSSKFLQVSLTGPPSGVVTVSVAKVVGDLDITAVPVTPLVYDSSNWMSNRFLKVTASHDADILSGVATIELAASGGIASVYITAAERDDDSLGIEVDTSVVFVTEGKRSSFTVKLTAEPTSSVTVTVARVSGDSDISISAGTSLFFEPSTWMKGQTVTLKAAQDVDALAGEALIQCSSSELSPVMLTALEKDDDTIGVALSTTSLSIVEGSTGSFSIRLAERPSITTTVTVTRVSGDPYIGVVSGSVLIFSRQNWSSYQVVKLAAIPDPDKTDRTAYFECCPIDGQASTVIATSLDSQVISMDNLANESLMPADADLNGLPDAWEIFHFGGLKMLGIVPDGDHDGDGSPNRVEYFAGTNPLDSSSFPFLEVTRNSGQIQVSFKAIQAEGAGYEGKTRLYSLQHCSDLGSGIWNEVPGEGAIVAENQRVNYIGFESEGGHGFYRFTVSLQ